MIADVRLPEKWSKGSAGGPQWMTDVVPLASGDEYREARWIDALWKYEIAHNVKTPEAIAELRAFQLARRGQRDGFLLKDWLDYTSKPGGDGLRAATDQPLGTGDGATTAFQLVKRYADAIDPYDRPIAWPVAGTVLVAVDGAPLGTGWSVNRGTGVVTFAAAPADGAALTAGFEFDVPVRFEDDWLSITWDTINSRSAGSVPLIEVRS